MEGMELLAQVRAATRTELDRLGSDKALVAATGAVLETEAVLAVVAGTERAVRDAAREWGEAAGGEPARQAFAAVADAAAGSYETVLAELDREAVAAEAGVVALDTGAGDDAERLGALVGASLVADRTLLQAVSFFVNEADERRADLARAVRADATDRAEAAAEAVGAVRVDGSWDRAGDAASRVVRAAYGGYVEALEGMGVDPKPVC